MTWWPVPLLGDLALALTGAGLVAAGVVLVAARRPLFAVKVLLDFLLAAGLLRLTGDPEWATIATAAAIVAVRRVVGFGLRAGRRS